MRYVAINTVELNGTTYERGDIIAPADIPASKLRSLVDKGLIDVIGDAIADGSITNANTTKRTLVPKVGQWFGSGVLHSGTAVFLSPNRALFFPLFVPAQMTVSDFSIYTPSIFSNAVVEYALYGDAGDAPGTKVAGLGSYAANVGRNIVATGLSATLAEGVHWFAIVMSVYTGNGSVTYNGAFPMSHVPADVNTVTSTSSPMRVPYQDGASPLPATAAISGFTTIAAGSALRHPYFELKRSA